MSSCSIFLPGVGRWTVERARSWPAELGEGWSFSHSSCYICPRCLKQWAFLAFEGDEILHIQPQFCERCPPTAGSKWFADRPVVPGSLLWGYCLDRPLLESLPPELVRREFQLTLKRMEIELWNS